MPPTPADRAAGCLMGLAVGDALGAPARGMNAAEVFRQFGLISDGPTGLLAGPLRCTNSPLQARVVFGELTSHGGIDGTRLVDGLHSVFDPGRKHDPRTRAVLEAAGRREDWRTVAATVANDSAEAAVRAAAVGLAFAHDFDRVWQEAKASGRVTHTDPLAIEGAQLFAGAVALVAAGQFTNRRTFLTTLHDRARTDEYRWALKTAARLKRQDSVAVLGSESAAARSVVTAIACFAATPDDYPLAVGRAVGLGGATDYLGAMTGALCGTFGGPAALPNNWLARLEPLHLEQAAAEFARRQAK